MKGLSRIRAVLCGALPLTSCQWEDSSTEGLPEDFDSILEQLSRSQLTKDTALHRESGENCIMADYNRFSGNVEMTYEYAEG